MTLDELEEIKSIVSININMKGEVMDQTLQLSIDDHLYTDYNYFDQIVKLAINDQQIYWQPGYKYVTKMEDRIVQINGQQVY